MTESKTPPKTAEILEFKPWVEMATKKGTPAAT